MATPLNLLACPVCRGDLRAAEQRLTCEACGRRYPLVGDVPRLMLDDATPEEERAPGLLGRAASTVAAFPFMYDVIQRAAGAAAVQQRLRPLLSESAGKLVLDVGAGTGNLERLLPPSAEYLWLDPDPTKLRGFRSKSKSAALLADATRIPLRDQSIDWSISIGIAHHLDDAHLSAMLDELRRVTRERILFLDGVLSSRRWSRILWRYDRGRHPRSAAALHGEIERRFAIRTRDEFDVFHSYLLVTAN